MNSNHPDNNVSNTPRRPHRNRKPRGLRGPGASSGFGQQGLGQLDVLLGDTGNPAAPMPLKDKVAVALQYDHHSDEAPHVVATGRGHVAEKILQLAFSHGIKVRQDADLAQILSVLDVDSEIPVEAFAAVVEILAYVYRANGDWPPKDFSEQDSSDKANSANLQDNNQPTG